MTESIDLCDQLRSIIASRVKEIGGQHEAARRTDGLVKQGTISRWLGGDDSALSMRTIQILIDAIGLEIVVKRR